MIAQVVQAMLAFGSNLGEREQTIRAAQDALVATPGISDFRPSPLRETVAFGIDGPNPDAPKYLNGVATLTTTLSPHELLELVQRVEHDHGRTRDVRWGDRTLDIDIILYGGRVIQEEGLQVPHPRAHERDFVLSPWLDLDPNAVLMGHGRVSDLLRDMGDTTTPYKASLTVAVEEIRDSQ